MIKLTRIQGEVVYINETNIQWIESNPDTTITFMNGYRFIVKETVEQVLEFIKNSDDLEGSEQEFSPLQSQNIPVSHSSEISE